MHFSNTCSRMNPAKVWVCKHQYLLKYYTWCIWMMKCKIFP